MDLLASFTGLPIVKNDMVPQGEAWALMERDCCKALWVSELPRNQADPVEWLKTLVIKQKRYEMFVAPWQVRSA